MLPSSFGCRFVLFFTKMVFVISSFQAALDNKLVLYYNNNGAEWCPTFISYLRASLVLMYCTSTVPHHSLRAYRTSQYSYEYSRSTLAVDGRTTRTRTRTVRVLSYSYRPGTRTLTRTVSQSVFTHICTDLETYNKE